MAPKWMNTARDGVPPERAGARAERGTMPVKMDRSVDRYRRTTTRKFINGQWMGRGQSGKTFERQPGDGETLAHIDEGRAAKTSNGQVRAARRALRRGRGAG